MRPTWGVPGWLFMTKHTLLTRPGMTAIAAFAALSSAPLLAQDADPLAPASDVAQAVPSTPPVEVASEPTAAPVADPLAATAGTTPVARTTRTPTVARTTRTAADRSATRAPTPGIRPAGRAVAPAAAVTEAQDTSVAAPVAAVPPPMTMPEPVSADAAADAAIATAPTGPPAGSSPLPDEALPIAGGLGALALAAAAIALRRRRRIAAEHAQVRYDEPAFAAPVGTETAFVEPVSARAERPIMAWGAPAAAATAAAPAGDGAVPSGVDAKSHAAAAYRGPSADNPSLSLRKRLKRAAFLGRKGEPLPTRICG